MRLIDGDELLEGYKVMGYDPTEHPEESYMEGWCNGFNAAVDHCMHHVIHAQTVMVVNAAPTVEQPEIIRCRDCKYWEREKPFATSGRCFIWECANRKGSDYCSEARRTADD